MQPRKITAIFVGLSFLASVLSNSVYAKPPEPKLSPQLALQTIELSQIDPNIPQQGIQNISNFTLQMITPAQFPSGTAFDLCFGFFLQSPNNEYGDHVDVDLPNDWTVNSVAPNSIPPAGACQTTASPIVSGVNAGNVVYWQSNGYPPSTGCGAWAPSGGTLYNFCTNVTIPNFSSSPWSFPWTFVGDGYGEGPHSVSGTYGPIGPQFIYLPLILK